MFDPSISHATILVIGAVLGVFCTRFSDYCVRFYDFLVRTGASKAQVKPSLSGALLDKAKSGKEPALLRSSLPITNVRHPMPPVMPPRPEPKSACSHFDSINELSKIVFERNVDMGFWSDLATGASTVTTRNMCELLCMIHSEVSEAMEAHRKGLSDSHLPHRSGLEVELADAVIRILDIAGSRGIPLGTVIHEKMAYNATRADHKLENRQKEGGKKW